jgi:O-antigen ligase
MSGSRAALAAPLLSLLLAAILQHYSKGRSLIQALLSLGLIAGLILGSLQLWYRYSPDAAINRLSDGMRFPTALCWAKAPIQQGKALFGLGYNQKVRSHCDGDHLPIVRAAGRPEGLPHAHNVGAQLMAETGLAGLTALVGTCLWAGQRLRQRLIAAPCGDPIVLNTLLPLGLYLLLMAMSTSYEIYLMLNQVLIGFTLAALTSPNKETA